ncbi:PREDICTED: uncharacterized protein LOC104822001 [Tarenaya hassleriana]|uniref:uncharacterized protein LOC104822001 n=1 Tax=Tarenaya hassleriana TaxID=28532 RepID=UPI00053C2ABF|nr:PREDICTED: uncharacterized protein LOC104822001 [Tarenaya hassleriana]
MGISKSQGNTHNIFLLCNYILLCSSSSCIFLTLSLRLFPSLAGLSLILLHVITISTAVSGCNAVAAAAAIGDVWYGVHMVSTVLAAIFQGSVSVLVFTRTGDFLRTLKSYVREDDGSVILKLAGGLCCLIFCVEWAVLVLAFLLKYNAYLEETDDDDDVKVVQRRQNEEDLKDFPSYPLQIKF